MHRERPDFLSSQRSGCAWLEWRSLAVGALATLTVAYACVVRPARQQSSGLERQLAALADVVARLEVAEGDVAVTGRLLAAIEEQSRRVAAAEAGLARLTAVHERLTAQAERLERATATVAHLEALGRSLDTIDRHELEAAQAAAERMARLGSTLAAQAVDIDAAQERLDRLVDLKGDLLHHSSDLGAAETTLVHLQELTDWLASSAAVVGDLRHFVVDVVLLQPSVERAREALEPVISLTRAGRSRGGRQSPAQPAREYSAQPAGEYSAQPAGEPSPADEPAATAETTGGTAEGIESPVLTSAVQPATATSR